MRKTRHEEINNKVMNFCPKWRAADIPITGPSFKPKQRISPNTQESRILQGKGTSDQNFLDSDIGDAGDSSNEKVI